MKRKSIIIIIAAAVLAAVTVTIVVILLRDRIETISIDQASEELKDYKFKDYDNLTFDCDPTPFRSEELYVIQVKYPDDYENEEDRNRHIDYMSNKEKELFGYEINRAEIKSVIPSELEYYVQDGPQCTLYPSHTFMFTDGAKNDPLLRRSGTNETDIGTYTDLRKQSDITLEVSGKEMNLGRAAKYAEQSFKKHFEDIFNENEKIKAVDAIGVKGENGELNYIVVRLQHTIDGIGVNENGYVNPYSAHGYIKPSYMLAYMTSEDDIISYSNNYYYKTIDKEKTEKIVSLSTATDILSRSLAQNSKYTVKDIELKYTTVINGEHSKKTYDDTAEMRPMWSFVLKYSSGHSFQFVNSVTAYVDAISGMVYYCSSDSFEESEPVL